MVENKPTPGQTANDQVEELSQAQAANEVAARGSRLGRLFSRLRKSPQEVTGEPTDSPDYPEIDSREARKERLRGENGIKQAQDYLGEILPDTKVRLLSDEGSDAIVFEDDENTIYKVKRNSTHYSYNEDEMGALTLLSEEGLAPKPHMLIDADLKYRTETAGGYPKRHFKDVPIKRENKGGKFPVIVMDKIETARLNELNDQEIIAEFDRFLEVATRHDLLFGDVEFVMDAKTRKMTIIDAGGTSKVTQANKQIHFLDGREPKDHFPDLTYDDFKKALIIVQLLHHASDLGPLREIPKVAEELKSNGIDGIHRMLLEDRHDRAANHVTKII